jgi:chitosanase
MRQITFGSKQTTEQVNLKILIQMYVDAKGEHAEAMTPYLPKIGKESLVNDVAFLDLLKKSGNDPVMIKTQDAFFEAVYLNPARQWFTDNGFTLPLSMAVVFDSYIHSGRIRDDIRNMRGFTAVPPAKGGDEKEWIKQYVFFRKKWLLRKDAILKRTVYRMITFEKAIEAGNWDLSQIVYANGINIKAMIKMPLIDRGTLFKNKSIKLKVK